MTDYKILYHRNLELYGSWHMRIDIFDCLCFYRELSAQIDADAERRKQLEVIHVGGAHPPLHTPTYHHIYTTLKNNRRITRLQVNIYCQLNN